MESTIDFSKAANQSLQVLLSNWYNANPPATYGTSYWIIGSYLWQSANALETILDYQIMTSDNSYSGVIDDVYGYFNANYYQGWFQYYDDEGWWGISCIKAYQVTGEDKWLKLANQIYADLQQGWDNNYGGGIWFKRSPTTNPPNFKGDIANLLMIVLAGRMYNCPNSGADQSYLNWALKTWDWMQQQGLIGADQLMIDELDASGKPVIGYPYTYTQGVMLGAAIELYNATNNILYINQAILTADAAIRVLIWPSGVLQEFCEQPGANACNNNETLFKGIFIRYLSYLVNLLSGLENPPAGILSGYSDSLSRYISFIQLNATSVWTNYPNATYGTNWNGGSAASAVPQIAGTNAMIAAIRFVLL